jgi:hypothetical protein
MQRKEKVMNNLVKLAIEAHGGMEHWQQVRQISATLAFGGAGLYIHSQAAFANAPTRLTVDTQEQRTRFDPFMGNGRVGIYESTRTAVESRYGTVIEELKNPRDSFKPDTERWSDTQLVYFVGYAMWTYLTLPFLLLSSGVECKEGVPYAEDGETWRTLQVTFPKSITTQSSEQTLYIDDNGLIRRHDYDVEISGGAQAAHYLYEQKNFDGVVFSTKRRIYQRGPDLKPSKDMVVFSADLSDFEMKRTPSAPSCNASPYEGPPCYDS